MRVYDRWHDTRGDLDSAVIPGRYTLDAPATWGPVTLHVDDRLMPLGGDRWTLSGDEPASGTFAAPTPSLDRTDTLRDSLRQLAAALGDSIDPALTTLSPLVPDLEARAAPPRFVEQLEAELGHLLDIARAPESRLTIEVERELLGRVKRPARRAPLVLATRADDWEAPTLTGVRPRRLLARRIDEHLDFYENRAAARLIDHLLRWLTRRAGELDRLIALLDRMHDFSGRVHAVDYRRRERLTTLWSELGDPKATREAAKATAERLAVLRRKLRGTLTGPLYRGVPRQARVGAGLRQTNLLVNDKRYRFVVRLWRGWREAEGDITDDPAACHAAQQRLADDFDRFALLVTARAFASLGVTATPTASGQLTLSHPDTGLDGILTFGPAGLDLTADGWPPLRLVPLPVVLDDAGAVNALREALDSPRPLDDERRCVALCIDGEPRANEPPTPPYDPARSARPALIAISPLCLESVERVRRALEWWLHAPPIARWTDPIELPASLQSPIVAATPWLAVIGEGRAAAVRATQWPTPTDRADLDALADDVKALRRDPNARRAAVDDATEALRRAVDRAAALSACPSCTAAAQRPTRVDARALSFACHQCNTTWGSNTCSACGRSTPFIDRGEPDTRRLGHRCIWCP